MQASFEGQLPEHRGKPKFQQTPAGNDEASPGLERLSMKMRSLERGMPGSISSPNILADIPNSDEAHGKEAAAQALAAKEAQMQRCQSWSQAPAIISRLTSWKEAGQDYSAMQVVPTGKRPLGSDMSQDGDSPCPALPCAVGYHRACISACSSSRQQQAEAARKA